MGKRSGVARAIEKIDKEIQELNAVRSRLVDELPMAPRKPRAVKVKAPEKASA